MSGSKALIPIGQQHRRKTVWLAVLFVLITIAGLTYVKWWPYYGKALSAAAERSIGTSILDAGRSAGTPSLQAAWEYALLYFKAVWKAAVLGILLGTLLQSMLPSQWLLKVLGKTTFGSTAAGGLAALPGMMCSCCAAPVAIGMRKQKVSTGAALAFWIGNPTLNPAVLVFMTFVLSWKFTLLRLFFGILLTFGVSYLANRFADPKAVADLHSVEAKERDQAAEPWWKRWVSNMASMLLKVIPAYVLAVLILGALQVWMFPHLGETAGNDLIMIFFFAVMGMLFVIPTAAEIPIIQSFMAFGLGTGPAAALLLTLPAISLPSLLMLQKSFPAKVLGFVILSVVALGILCGIAGMLVL
ncbi:permease [Paenibacillus sp. JSM ZJ436]|uniref:permease n=1 Tax=Paenibacillus sp. JSM ZJ436 TaxID=3376190 RepID=UPI003790B804